MKQCSKSIFFFFSLLFLCSDSEWMCVLVMYCVYYLERYTYCTFMCTRFKDVIFQKQISHHTCVVNLNMLWKQTEEHCTSQSRLSLVSRLSLCLSLVSRLSFFRAWYFFWEVCELKFFEIKIKKRNRNRNSGGPLSFSFSSHNSRPSTDTNALLRRSTKKRKKKQTNKHTHTKTTTVVFCSSIPFFFFFHFFFSSSWHKK